MTAIRAWMACATLLVVLATSQPTQANGPFGTYSGTWKGSGQIHLDSGASERIRCNAYYTPKDGGEGLGIALRCASTSYKIELRSQLRYEGGRVLGSWEERTFNASGEVTGQVSQSQIKLSVVGGGLTASMDVETSGSSQSVDISTNGSGLKRVSISLSKV